MICHEHQVASSKIDPFSRCMSHCKMLADKGKLAIKSHLMQGVTFQAPLREQITFRMRMHGGEHADPCDCRACPTQSSEGMHQKMYRQPNHCGQLLLYGKADQEFLLHRLFLSSLSAKSQVLATTPWSSH